MISQPTYLKEGDKVALVSPAYWMPEDTLLEAAEVIRSWGLQPVIGHHTNSLNVNVYAGTADERADKGSAGTGGEQSLVGREDERHIDFDAFGS